MTWTVEGKTFLVTGGASGLGALYAEAFLKEGAKKVAIVDISKDAGKATTARLTSSYPDKVSFFKCDVGIEAQVVATFDKVIAEVGKLDVLVNNAGIMNDSPNIVWKACVVNWAGLVSFTMRAVNHMSKAEGGAGGTIINISSIAGILILKELPAYCGSKAAVIHFGQSLALDPFYEQTGIRILTLCPGPTDTPLLHGLKARTYNEKLGDKFEKENEKIFKEKPPQKPESAVAALMTMLKEGANASVWLTTEDKPAQDITATVKRAKDEYLKVLFN